VTDSVAHGQNWYWWRSRFSRLPLNEFKLTMSILFDFATSTNFGEKMSLEKRAVMSELLEMPIQFYRGYLLG